MFHPLSWVEAEASARKTPEKKKPSNPLVSRFESDYFWCRWPETACVPYVEDLESFDFQRQGFKGTNKAHISQLAELACLEKAS